MYAATVFQHGQTSQGTRAAHSQVCLLVPVHRPHFAFLEKRLDLTYELVEGEAPHTVVVFNDEVAIHEYMERNPRHRLHSKIHSLSLRALVGDEFSLLEEFLESTSGKDEYHTGNYSGCLKRTPGRVFQAVKKLYGPLYSPEFCNFFWVSDAESWPFRTYNIDELLKHSFAEYETSAYQVVNSWHLRRECSHVTHDLHTDVSCSIMVHNGLEYDGYWDERDSSHELLVKKLQHTVFDINNWWIYERGAVKHLHDLVESRLNRSMASALVNYRLEATAFWTQYIQSLDSRADSILTKNFPDEVQAVFPFAFEQCCKCSTEQLPCVTLSSLFSPCFQQHATIQQIGNFIVQRLGIFGIFGNDINGIPVDLFKVEPRISWIINNANNWEKDHEMAVLQNVPGRAAYH